MTLPELKRPRNKEIPRDKDDGVRLVQEGFFVPGPNAKAYPGGEDRFLCPAGPGLNPIPRDGQWYAVTDYLLKRIRAGDAAEGSAAQIKAAADTNDPKPKKTAKPKGPADKE
jgi:hypothetical protein